MTPASQSGPVVERAEAVPERSEALRLRGTPEREVEAERFRREGRELYDQGRLEESIPRLRHAGQILRGLPASEQLALVAHDLGVAYYVAGRYGEAIQGYDTLLVLYRPLPNREVQATVLNHLGMAYEALEDYGAALLRYQASLKIWEELGKVVTSRLIAYAVLRFASLLVRTQAFGLPLIHPRTHNTIFHPMYGLA